MAPINRHIAWVYFFPNLLTQKGKVKEKPNVTKFKIADVVLACSNPIVNRSLLVAGSPWNNWEATPVL